MKRKLTTLLIASCMMLTQLANIPVAASDATPTIVVLPWNGAKASISLTFDDGMDSHRNIVIPALDKLGMKATFFVCASGIGGHDSDWIAAGAEGHEIGNHSIKHVEPNKVTDKQVAYNETLGAQKLLQDAYKTKVVSYDYPFCQFGDYKQYLKDTHVAARGGWGFDFYMNYSTTPDWLNIPSQGTSSSCSYDANYKNWIDTALNKNAWAVFMIHDVGGTDFSLSDFNKTINCLDSNKDIWVAPFGTVSGYWRAQKIIESTKPSETSNGAIYNWDVPSYFPQNIKLKVNMTKGTGYSIVQSGNTLVPDSNGVYTISFDAGSLKVVKGVENASNTLIDGWKKNDDNTWAYIKAGQNATGWQQVNDKWYLLKDDGVMATGWQNVNGKWYYLYSDGSMASNTTIEGYQLDANGAWIA